MRRILPIALLVVLVAVVLFLRSGRADVPADQFLTEREANALVLDVRTPGEYASGHLDGAVNINLFDDDFAEQVSTFGRDRPVYLYCGSGQRSGRAAAILTDLGFERAVNLGGYSALKAAGADVVEP